MDLFHQGGANARKIFLRYEQIPLNERDDVPVVIWRLVEWLAAIEHTILPMARRDLGILVEDAVQNWETDPVIAGQ